MNHRTTFQAIFPDAAPSFEPAVGSASFLMKKDDIDSVANLNNLYLQSIESLQKYHRNIPVEKCVSIINDTTTLALQKKSPFVAAVGFHYFNLLQQDYDLDTVRNNLEGCFFANKKKFENFCMNLPKSTEADVCLEIMRISAEEAYRKLHMTEIEKSQHLTSLSKEIFL